MSYEEALAYVSGLAPRGWRLGLDRMEEFVRRAGLSGSLGGPDGPRFIHIAGTNGKGTVTAYVQALLTASGYATGGFFSPYVYDPRERIQLNGELISESAFAEAVEVLKPVAETLDATEFGPVTEFEFKTALGLLFWRDQGCQWVALEVGLGGRLDATNIVQPSAVVIASIGLDHTAILGETLAQIASEKAGIIKAGVPVVVGSLPPEAMEVVAERAGELGCDLVRFGHEVGISGDEIVTPKVSLPLPRLRVPGQAARQNAALAVAAVEAAGVTPDEGVVTRALETTTIPGRFERIHVDGVEIVLDGAHNGEAASLLAATLREEYPGKRIVMVAGMVEGHDPARFFAPYQGLIDSVHLAPIDFHRAVSPISLVGLAEVLGPATAYSSVQEACQAALEAAGDGLILVAGSFYLLGPCKQAFQARSCSGHRQRRP